MHYDQDRLISGMQGWFNNQKVVIHNITRMKEKNYDGPLEAEKAFDQFNTFHDESS